MKILPLPARNMGRWLLVLVRETFDIFEHLCVIEFLLFCFCESASFGLEVETIINDCSVDECFDCCAHCEAYSFGDAPEFLF